MVTRAMVALPLPLPLPLVTWRKWITSSTSAWDNGSPNPTPNPSHL